MDGARPVGGFEPPENRIIAALGPLVRGVCASGNVPLPDREGPTIRLQFQRHPVGSLESVGTEPIGETSMESLNQLKNIVVMAVADGALAEDEVALLSDRCVELGIGEVELQQALAYALGDAPALQLPREPAQQEQLLRDLIRMMGADGVLAESEKRLFALAAAKMRFDSARLHALIDEVIDQRDLETE